jgi:hypothetical protein
MHSLGTLIDIHLASRKKEMFSYDLRDYAKALGHALSSYNHPVETIGLPSVEEQIAIAMKTIGSCVKSKKKRDGDRPKYHGILAKHDDEVWVISHNHDKKRWTWKGSRDEYYDFWICD